MNEEITVTDILGKDFFCQCLEPRIKEVCQTRETPLSNVYSHRIIVTKRCSKCGKAPIPPLSKDSSILGGFL